MRVDDAGRRAVSRFTCVHQYDKACYAKAEIETGRTHQIRVHAAHLGAPLAGDKKYSNARQQRLWRKLGLKRLFLHASGLEITAPDGTPRTFSAPLPAPLRRCLDTLEGNA